MLEEPLSLIEEPTKYIANQSENIFMMLPQIWPLLATLRQPFLGKPHYSSIIKSALISSLIEATQLRCPQLGSLMVYLDEIEEPSLVTEICLRNRRVQLEALHWL